jgi:murein DD-endopeptidase MepM/ murein hydrolase activator NlpD
MAYRSPATDQLYPLLGERERQSRWASIDLQSCSDYDLGTHEGLRDCIQAQLHAADALIGYGGYLEKRTIYQRSDHFTEAEELRNIHLGCDIWASVGQPIYSPLAGEIHSFAYNAAPFDYGATLIVKHEWTEGRCFALYGHIQKADIEGIQKGDAVQRGQVLCHVGDLGENGGWVPHLHFQLIRDIDDYAGDYPGVAPRSQLAFYRENCPDPTSWLL